MPLCYSPFIFMRIVLDAPSYANLFLILIFSIQNMFPILWYKLYRNQKYNVHSVVLLHIRLIKGGTLFRTFMIKKFRSFLRAKCFYNTVRNFFYSFKFYFSNCTRVENCYSSVVSVLTLRKL